MANNAGTQATGYDGDKRLINMRHKLGPVVLAGFSYTHDRMDNRTTEQRQHTAQTSENWVYDSLYRLVDQKRDIPSGGGPPAEHRAWQLDGAQNWALLSILPQGGPPTQLTQTMNDLNSYGPFRKLGSSGDVPKGDNVYIFIYSGVK